MKPHEGKGMFGRATAAVVASTMATAVCAAAFEQQQVIVAVQGRGPEVILAPGLTAHPRIGGRLVNALPGDRHHLVQVRGFSGNASGADAAGNVAAARFADEVRTFRR